MAMLFTCTCLLQCQPCSSARPPAGHQQPRYGHSLYCKRQASDKHLPYQAFTAEQGPLRHSPVLDRHEQAGLHNDWQGPIAATEAEGLTGAA